MTDEIKPKRNMDDALQSLRNGYEQTVDTQADQPEPIEGKEIRQRRFPKVVSYFVGGLAVGMFVMAVFLFSIQSKADDEPTVADVEATGEVETAVVAEDLYIPPPPTPPIFDQTEDPPIPDDAIPPPPEPTPWPTPPIEP